MLKPYQLAVGIALLFGCFHVDTRSLGPSVYRRPNATLIKPATNFQPWSGPKFNNTLPNAARFNGTRVIQPVQSSRQYGGIPNQATAPQSNIGFHPNVLGLSELQRNSTYGFISPAQPFYGVFPNGTKHGNLTYTQVIRPNSTNPYTRLFKFW